jgi:FKBP-type peptidyl-prolyl cis-trans isomerase (trigger factor)
MKKVEVKKIDATKREINIQAEGDVVKNKFETVFKEIAKNAKVPGFRPGSAPRDIIEKNFSGAATEQVLKELIPEIYDEVIKTEQLEVIELPSISEVKLDRSNLSFKATVEVSPQIKLKNYKGLKVGFKQIEVTDDEVKRSIDSFKEMRKVENVDDALARSAGYPNLKELQESVKRQLMLQKDNLQRQRIEHEVITAVTDDLEIKLPQAFVQRQLDDQLRRAKVDLAMKGMPREEIETKEKDIIKELEPQARRQVKTYLVLAEIAKKEQIPLDDHMAQKVIELMLREAEWQI